MEINIDEKFKKIEKRDYKKMHETSFEQTSINTLC